MVVSLLTHICVTRPQWAKANFISGYFDGLFLGLYCLPVEYHDHVWQMSLTRLGCRICTLCYAISSALKAHRGKTWRILTLEIKKKKTCLAKTWRKLANAMPLWSDGQLTIQRILWMTVIRESKNPTTIRKCNHALAVIKKLESVMPTVVNTPWGDKAARVITFSNQHDLSFLGSKLASISWSNSPIFGIYPDARTRRHVLMSPPYKIASINSIPPPVHEWALTSAHSCTGDGIEFILL